MNEGPQRCRWAAGDPLLAAYHDAEWGVPEFDARALWEKLMLDGFQAGLAYPCLRAATAALRLASLRATAVERLGQGRRQERYKIGRPHKARIVAPSAHSNTPSVMPIGRSPWYARRRCTWELSVLLRERNPRGLS